MLELVVGMLVCVLPDMATRPEPPWMGTVVSVQGQTVLVMQNVVQPAREIQRWQIQPAEDCQRG